jgi:hypothetical protein
MFLSGLSERISLAELRHISFLARDPTGTIEGRQETLGDQAEIIIGIK